MFRIIIRILILYLALQPFAHAKMYKWVDKEGVTQFSTFPPDNIEDEFQTLSSKNNPNIPISKYIIGTWFYNKNNKKYKIIISESNLNFYEIVNDKSIIAVSKSNWTLTGKTLNLRYTKIRHRKLIEKKGKYFIAKVNDAELIIINDKTNIKIRARRDNYNQSSLIKNSPLIRKLIGYWTGTTEGHNINFKNNGIFTITGKLNRSTTTVYEGRWEYTDPKLTFSFTIDKLIPFGRKSKVGKSESYSVKKLTDDALHIQSNKTGKYKQFLRKKKKSER